MATIVSTTQAKGLPYPNASIIDRSPYTGALAALVRESSGALAIYYSNNNGASWTDANCRFTRSNLAEWGGIFVDVDGFIHLAYRVHESGTDKICYRRAGQDDDGDLTWDSESVIASATAGSSGDVYQGVDLAVTKIGSTYYVHFAVGTKSGANVGVTMFSMTIRLEYQWYVFPYWAYTINNGLIAGTRQWLAAGSGAVRPSIDLRHSGDGHTGSQPDLWVSWGSSYVSMTKISYASSKWSGSTAVGLATPSSTMSHVPGRFDGTRFLVPVFNGSRVDVYERDISNTNTTVRQSPTHTTGVIRCVAINYVNSTGDFRVYAIGTSNALLYYVDYVRATNSWGAWTTTSQTITGDITNFGTRRGSFGNARFDLYHQTGSSAYPVAHTAQVLVFPPNTPTITAPATGSSQEVSAALPFTWDYSDPDPADTQSGYALSRQIGAGALAYWNAGTSTWGVSEFKNVTSTPGVTLPSSWGADSDANHTYRVKVWDSTNIASNYSAPVVITPSTKVNPTITAPTNGATIIYNNVNVTWTSASQSAFRVRLYETTGMVLVHDSGIETGGQLSYSPSTVLKDNTGYTVVLNTINLEGLPSDDVSVAFSVDFVEPPTPVLDVSPIDTLGVIRLSVSNPTPTGMQPAVVQNELWRRIIDAGGEGTRIAIINPSGVSASTYDDFTAASRVNYEYMVKATAVNGTSAQTDWVQ